MPVWLEKFLPILGLLVAIAIVVRRLPQVDLGHSADFKRRRVLNWVPLGMTYAFLYFGRYNLSAIAGELDKAGILSKSLFNEIDGLGALVYGLGFLINGPLTDRFGGRATMLLATGGSCVVNLLMALAFQSVTPSSDHSGLGHQLMILNGINMYFQSFGAVSIVKVNAPWFHVRERGVLGGLFGILISLGLYFSYDWALALMKAYGITMAFWVPGAVLGLCVLVTFFLVRDTPSDVGFADFDTGDASAGDTRRKSLGEVVRLLFSQRVIWILVAIEFCSGFLRQAVMKQYRLYAKAVGDTGFVYENWGMLLCIAGILGGVFAGFISDHVFHSRRGPVSGVLYAGMLVGTIGALVWIGQPMLAWSVVFMSLCVIGVHGMLSGTASADFGGTKNAGVVTGIIDGFVYLGSSAQGLYYAKALPAGDLAKDPANWKVWPQAMLPVAVIGLLLCMTIWNARPSKGASAH
jgi:MFS transporter, OPA family, glycerol-3-phosphate transporter